MLYIYDNIRDVLVIINTRDVFEIIFDNIRDDVFEIIFDDAYYLDYSRCILSTMIQFFLIDCMHSNLNTKLFYLSSGLVK